MIKSQKGLQTTKQNLACSKKQNHAVETAAGVYKNDPNSLKHLLKLMKYSCASL